MGGYGSGRTGGWPTKEATDSLTLNVNRVMAPVMRELRKQGMRTVPDGLSVALVPFPWRWRRADEDEPWATVNMSLTVGADWGEAVLSYDIGHFSGPTGPQNYTVRLIATPCRFGGVRWWWLCPATGRRCAKLYLPNGGRRFLSRGSGAYRLGYASQRGDWIARAHGRAARLHRKLGSDYGHAQYTIPERPKGMRRRTYERIADELIETEMQLKDGIAVVTARLTRRWG